MSLYIDPNNQKLLWDLCNKNPLVSQIFPPNFQKNKEEWFKNIISQIYYNLPPTISRDLLLIKNKETITIMINDLKSRIPKQLNQEPIYSRNTVDRSINAQFEQRQKEYEQMNKPPVLPDVSFTEKLDDGVIKNMDELIQQQLRERELDLKFIKKEQPENPLKINIKEPIPIETKEIINIQEKEKSKKQVSWKSDNDIFDKMRDILKKQEYLIEYLENKIPDFKIEFSDFYTKKIVREILYEEIERIL